MLVAKDQNGIMVSLYEAVDEELAVFKTFTFFCPCCNRKVHLKAGKIKIPHFAHAVHEACSYASEGESEEHLQGKKQLREWLRHQGNNVEMEKYFSIIKQRADLYLECPDGNIAIEFQCSILSVEEIKKRTRAYIKEKITPVWILSYNHLKRYGHTFSLSAFHWHATIGPSLAPSLLFYSPSLQEFTILNQLTPFSARHIFCFPKNVKQRNISLLQLRMQTAIHPLPCQEWMNRKKSWRLKSVVHANISDIFHQALYCANLTPATLPNEIGIPVPYMHLYETACIHWQFWLYVNLFKDKCEGELIHSQNIRAFIIQSIKEKKIKLRFLPYRKSIDPFLPVKFYLYLLVKLGVLEADIDGHFKLLRKIQPYNPAKPEEESSFFKKVGLAYNEIMKAEKEA